MDIKTFAAALLVLTMGVPSFGSPGFGLVRKKVVVLQTRLPAAVRLANTTIAFTGSATDRQYTPVEASLLTNLETELLKNESTLTKKNSPSEAQWTLNARVTGYSLLNPQQKTQQVGKATTTTVHWVGTLNVAYQVLDRSGHSHAAGNVTANYDKSFAGNGSASSFLHMPSLGKQKGTADKRPQTTEDVKQLLIKDVVSQIASALGNTSVALEVQVANGDDNLNEAATFMADKLWSRALDKLEATPAYAKPEDEAFRQYDIGVVYEALSYDSKDSADQRENIYKAAEYYDKALELRPKEKYFVDSVARSKEAVARFKALDDQSPTTKSGKHPQQVSAAKSAPASTVSQASKPASNTKTIRLEDVVEMIISGVPQDQIVEVIRSSPVEFDPRDKDTVIAIAKAKLPVSLQNELRKKVGAPTIASRTTAARKTSAPAPK
jgi:hypothetical protein